MGNNSLTWDEMVSAAKAAGVSTSTASEERKPIPEDKYIAKVRDAKAVKASTGTDMIKVTFEVVGGPHANRYVWTNIVPPAQQEHVRYFKDKIGAFGLTLDMLAQQKMGLAEVAERIKGKHAQIVVQIKTQPNGKPGNDVKFINKAPEAELQRLGISTGSAAAPSGGTPAAWTAPAPAASAPAAPPAPSPGTPPSPRPDQIETPF